MIIRKKYERLVNTGKFENVKIGIELEQEVKLSKGAEVQAFSKKLGILASRVVDEEAEKVKEEAEAKNAKEEEK